MGDFIYKPLILCICLILWIGGYTEKWKQEEDGTVFHFIGEGLIYGKCGGAGAFVPEFHAVKIISVSYTHLDVYKRQHGGIRKIRKTVNVLIAV